MTRESFKMYNRLELALSVVYVPYGIFGMVIVYTNKIYSFSLYSLEHEQIVSLITWMCWLRVSIILILIVVFSCYCCFMCLLVASG